MDVRRTIHSTRNFADNLDEIERFLQERDAPQAFQALLQRLLETVIPNLQRFPGMGLDFLARRPQSVEGLERLEALGKRLGPRVEIREYITGEYLLLYAVRKDVIYLLSIKHHLQLSFDLREHWYP
jgi:plasmid stabilization system protein ParE